MISCSFLLTAWFNTINVLEIPTWIHFHPKRLKTTMFVPLVMSSVEMFKQDSDVQTWPFSDVFQRSALQISAKHSTFIHDRSIVAPSDRSCFWTNCFCIWSAEGASACSVEFFLTNQRFFCPAHDKCFRDSNLNSFTPETLENHYVCTSSNVISLNVQTGLWCTNLCKRKKSSRA